MPRTARKISSSNIYHVILRGINRQTIFEDDGDRHYFMTVLKYYKGISGYKLHAFCLMGNHVHLLIEPAGEPLGQVFKRVGVRYVSWYNRKYERTGHLFQDRFRSENVESEQYYRTVLRYILQNPMKAGLEKQPGSWRWSSFLAYWKGAGSITDTQYAVFRRVRTLSATEYRQLISTYSDHITIEESIRERFFDAIEYAINRHGGSISVFDTIDLQMARKP